jgi:hypothetical protein
MIDDADDPSPGGRSVFGDPCDLRGMDARVLAAYRREFRPRPGVWGRPLRIPRPVAALVLLGLLACATLAVRARSTGESAKAPSSSAEGAVQSVRHDPPVVTNTSLAGFQPVDEMQVVVVGGDAP